MVIRKLHNQQFNKRETTVFQSLLRHNNPRCSCEGKGLLRSTTRGRNKHDAQLDGWTRIQSAKAPSEPIQHRSDDSSLFHEGTTNFAMTVGQVFWLPVRPRLTPSHGYVLTIVNVRSGCV